MAARKNKPLKAKPAAVKPPITPDPTPVAAPVQAGLPGTPQPPKTVQAMACAPEFHAAVLEFFMTYSMPRKISDPFVDGLHKMQNVTLGVKG